MSYERVEVDTKIEERFGKLKTHIKIKDNGHTEHIKIDDVYVNHVSPVEDRYVFHVKTGHFGNYQHYTVSAISRNGGDLEVLEVFEGKKTLW